MRHSIARLSSFVISVSCSISLMLLTGGCEPLPPIAAPGLPSFGFPDFTHMSSDFARMFPDFSRMMADLFGTNLDTPVVQQPPAPHPAVADRVIVLKSRRLLQLAQNGQVFESYPIALGRDPVGPKQRQGDGRTPEGIYRIDWRTEDTKYTRELHISYPEERDRERARAQNVDPGGAIFVHGLPRDYGAFDPPVWYRDWTEGCISVGNVAITKIWDAVPDGTPIEIRP
jgi:lipoprotein-anchoring transpeptidase ErfK/SrfK